LTRKEHDDLISFVAEAYANNHALMMHHIVHYLTERCGKAMDASSVRHMHDRDPRAKSCTSLPTEEKCLQVTAENITAYFACLTEATEGVPADFVYDMDEMGDQECADRQE
jgi:hypothetical protein